MLSESQPALHAGSGGETRFIARQPILDSAQRLYGYELLFRSGADSSFADMNHELAAKSTLDLSLLLGAGYFTEGHRAFINCTRYMLCSGLVRMLPPALAVLEVLEDVPADAEIVRRCRQLKAAGYTIALDDIVSDGDRPELMDLADIVKVDFLLTGEPEQQKIARHFTRRGTQLLAEKVETHEQFRSAESMGYTLFQGYFFCRPQTLKAHDLPAAQLGYLEVLRRAHERELDLHELECVIREEPSLTFRLLRYLNSAAWGVYPINSILQALTMLGDDEIRKWLSMVAAVSLAGPRSRELIRMALVRARFCELVAEHLQVARCDFFLAGLFSLLEAIMDRPLAQILQLVPISDSCREALNGGNNSPGLALKLATEFEAGHWEAMPKLCAELSCSQQQAWRWQLEAYYWVRLVLEKHNEAAKRGKA